MPAFVGCLSRRLSRSILDRSFATKTRRGARAKLAASSLKAMHKRPALRTGIDTFRDDLLVSV
jgi:hypothetical protein